MKTVMTQTKMDFKRAYLRNPRFAFFSLLIPIGFYLLFTKVMNQGLVSASFNLQYMVSMTTYSLILSNVFTLSTLLYNDMREGLLALINLSPTSKATYYTAKLLNLGVINGLTIIVIFVVAALSNQLQLAWTTWLLTAGWLWLASLPLCLLGISISFLNDDNQIQLAANLLAFPLAILSGLWWPLALMPKQVQVIGQHLPVYPINQIAQSIVLKKTVHFADYGVTLGWTVILVGLVVYLNHHQKGARH